MFTELGRVLARARVELDQDEDMIPKRIVDGMLNIIECQIKMTERQVFESLGDMNKVKVPSVPPGVSPEVMYEAGVEAIDHMSQANWQGRDDAAKLWLARILKGDMSKSLDEIQEEINKE